MSGELGVATDDHALCVRAEQQLKDAVGLIEGVRKRAGEGPSLAMLAVQFYDLSASLLAALSTRTAQCEELRDLLNRVVSGDPFTVTEMDAALAPLTEKS